MKKVLIDKVTKVVIDVVDTAVVKEGGIATEREGVKLFYCDHDGSIEVVSMEVPETVKPQKHKLVNGAFVVNPDFQEPVTIDSLKEQIAELQVAINVALGL